MVQDLQTEQKWYFLCNSWLAIDIGDCLLDKVFPVSSEVDLKSFRWSKKAQMPPAKIAYFLSLIESLVLNHCAILNENTEQQQQALSWAFNEDEWLEEKIKENPNLATSIKVVAQAKSVTQMWDTSSFHQDGKINC